MTKSWFCRQQTEHHLVIRFRNIESVVCPQNQASGPSGQRERMNFPGRYHGKPQSQRLGFTYFYQSKIAAFSFYPCLAISRKVIIRIHSLRIIPGRNACLPTIPWLLNISDPTQLRPLLFLFPWNRSSGSEIQRGK